MLCCSPAPRADPARAPPGRVAASRDTSSPCRVRPVSGNGSESRDTFLRSDRGPACPLRTALATRPLRIGNRVRNGLAIYQVQSLRQAEIGLGARTRRRIRAADGRTDRGSHPCPRADRATARRCVSGGTSGKTRAARRSPASARPSIASAFRRRGMACEKLSVSFAFHSLVVNAGLIGARVDDGSHQVLQIEIVIHEVFRQRIEQRRIAGRIRSADIVHRIDNALARRSSSTRGWPWTSRRTDCPSTVTQSASAMRRLASGSGTGAVLAVRGRHEEVRLHHAVVFRMLHVEIVALVVDDLFAALRNPAGGRRSEKNAVIS